MKKTISKLVLFSVLFSASVVHAEELQFSDGHGTAEVSEKTKPLSLGCGDSGTLVATGLFNGVGVSPDYDAAEEQAQAGLAQQYFDSPFCKGPGQVPLFDRTELNESPMFDGWWISITQTVHCCQK